MHTANFKPRCVVAAVWLVAMAHVAIAGVSTWTLPAPPTSAVERATQQIGYTIEPGFGRQIDALRGELVWNGSFDEDAPGTPSQNWIWSGYQPGTDLAAYPWWHSGYRIASWEGLGEPGKFTVDAGATTAAFRGDHGAHIANSGQFPARLFQRGLRIHSNTTYVVRAFVKTAPGENATGGKLDVSAGLYAEDSGWRVLIESSTSVGAEWALHSWRLANDRFDGEALLVISVPPGGAIYLDDLSMQNANQERGWRTDAVATIKQLAPAVIGFPGTAAAATYNWRAGVGPLTQRRPATNGFWCGYYDQSVGSAEVADLCRLTGAEALFCASLDALSPEQIGEWVAYCNASTNQPLGALRAEHGRAEPLAVHLWEIDAGTAGELSVSDRLSRVATAAQQVKAADPATRVILAVPATDATNDAAALSELLSAAGGSADFISVRRPLRELGEVAALVEDFNARNGTKLKLCNTDYALPGDAPAVTGTVSVTAAARTSWPIALAKAAERLDVRALGDHLPLICLAGLANGWGRNVLECSADSTWLSPFGRITALLAGTGNAALVEVPEATAGLRAWTTIAPDGKGLQLIVLNSSDAPATRTILPPAAFARARHLTTTTLGEDPSRPGNVRDDASFEELVRSPFQITAPARTISLLQLRD